MDLDRNDRLAIGLGAAAVLAIGIVAATLNDRVLAEAGGSGFGGSGGQRGIDTDPGESVGFGAGLSGDGGAFELCFPFLRDPVIVGLLLLIIGGAFLLAYYDTGHLFPAFVVAGTIGLPIGFIFYVLAFCGAPVIDIGLPGTGAGAGNVSLIPSGEEGGGIGAGDGGPSRFTILVGLLLVFGILASSILLLARGFSDDSDGEGGREEGSVPAGPELTAVGTVAERAADRLERADPGAENEIYRAWRELTRLLEIDSPETSTPGEFATAAIAAGMDPDDVDELTALFEAVRYGDASPTPEREQRAIAALRRIAEEHGEETPSRH